MTITIGWWLAPLVFTAAAFIWAHAVSGSGEGIDMTPILAAGAALIASLVAWLAYFIAV